MRFLLYRPAALNFFISPKYRLYRSLRLCGLFGSARLERFAQFHARLV